MFVREFADVRGNVKSKVLLIFFFKHKDFFSTTPTPPYSNEGLQPFPQTPFPLQGRDLTEKLQKPPAFRGFWYRGTRDELFMLPRLVSRGMQGSSEGTRDGVLMLPREMDDG